jgi:type VI secretion system VasD/TssJ family lipoprotein
MEGAMNGARRWLCCSLLAAAAFAPKGCPNKPAGASTVNLVVAADTDLNPDPSGQALSVVVRVYQLKDKGRLEAADYSAIAKSDRDALSDDFLDRQERVLQPGSQEALQIKMNPMASYLGVVALFRNPSGDAWRAIIPVSGKKPKVRLSLKGDSIEVGSVSK